MRYVRTTDASTEPVSSTELKAFLRIDHTDEDTLLTSLITAARQMAEDYCQRSFITQTWKAYANDFPDEIELLHGKVISVTTIKYSVTTALDTTLSSSSYNASTETDVCTIFPVDSWPETDNDFPNSIEVAYTAGYGSSESDVPEVIVDVIKRIAADQYEMRTSNKDMPKMMEKTWWMYQLDPYVLRKYA